MTSSPSNPSPSTAVVAMSDFDAMSEQEFVIFAAERARPVDDVGDVNVWPLLKRETVLENGCVFVQNDQLYFSPNTKDVISVPPFEEPRLLTKESDFVCQREDSLDEFLPVQWYRGPHRAFEMFIPNDVPFTYPFDVLSLKRMPTRVDILTHGDRIPQSVQDDFTVLEASLCRLVDAISGQLPPERRLFEPSTPLQRGGYNRPSSHGLKRALNSAYRTRDWMIVWMGAFLYLTLNFDWLFRLNHRSTYSKIWLALVNKVEPDLLSFASVAHVWLSQNANKIRPRGLLIRAQDLEKLPFNVYRLMELGVPIWLPFDKAAYATFQRRPEYRLWLPPRELVDNMTAPEPRPLRAPARAHHPPQTAQEYFEESLFHRPGQDMPTTFRSNQPLVTAISSPSTGDTDDDTADRDDIDAPPDQTLPTPTTTTFAWRYNQEGLLTRVKIHRGFDKHYLLRQAQWGRIKMYFQPQQNVVDFYHDWNAPGRSPSLPEPIRIGFDHGNIIPDWLKPTVTRKPQLRLVPPTQPLMEVDVAAAPPIPEVDVAQAPPIPEVDVAQAPPIPQVEVAPAPPRPEADVAPPIPTPEVDAASAQPRPEDDDASVMAIDESPLLADDTAYELDYADQIATAETMQAPQATPSSTLRFSEWGRFHALHVARCRFGFAFDPSSQPLPEVAESDQQQWKRVAECLQLSPGHGIPDDVRMVLPALFTYLEELLKYRNIQYRKDHPNFPHPHLSDLFPNSPHYLPNKPLFPTLKRLEGSPSHIVVGYCEEKGWDLVVDNAMDCLHACRLLMKGSTIQDVVVEFVEHGIAFNTVVPIIEPVISHDGPTLPVCPPEKTMDGQDVTYFYGMRSGLTQSLGIIRAAYMAGGIYWRSIRDACDPPTKDLFLNGPISDHGGVNGTLGTDVWDNNLSLGEKAALLGTYIKAKRMKWPPVHGANAVMPLSTSGSGVGKYATASAAPPQPAEVLPLVELRPVQATAPVEEFSFEQDENGRVKIVQDPDHPLEQWTVTWLFHPSETNMKRSGYLGHWTSYIERPYLKRIMAMHKLPGFRHPDDSPPQVQPSDQPPQSTVPSTVPAEPTQSGVAPQAQKPTRPRAQPLVTKTWRNRMSFSTHHRYIQEYIEEVAQRSMPPPPLA